jgi:hypothetical protein
MTTRHVISIATLAVLGVVVAAAIGLLTNAIAGDSIGLSADSLQPGRQLAPPQATRDHGANRVGQGHREEHHTTTTTSSTTSTTTTVPTSTVPTTTTTGVVEPGDDHGGSSGSSGPGSGSSGSSGPGSGGLDD